MSIPVWGSRGSGGTPPRQPLPGTREAWPQRVGWLYRLNRGISASRGPPAYPPTPHVDTPLGPAIEGTARTSDEALPAPVPGRVRTMSSPEWFARSRVKSGRRK